MSSSNTTTPVTSFPFSFAVLSTTPIDTAFLTITGVLLLTYLITSLRSTIAFWQKDGVSKIRKPAISPYVVPGLGNLVPFAFNTLNYLTELRRTYGAKMPVRIRVLNQKLYYVSGADFIQGLFRSSRDLTTNPSTVRVLNNTFGWPTKDLKILMRDESGTQAQPRAGTPHIESHNRIYHFVHQTLHTNLSGPGLADLGPRYAANLEKELDALEVGDEWVEFENLYAIIKRIGFDASMATICGPHLQRLSPDFTREFWEYDSRLSQLFKNIPRFLAPRAYELRDKLKSDIMKWHKFANEHVDVQDPEVAKLEWEQYFGSRLMRERAMHSAKVDDMSDEAHAANDLGMIWGANANAIPMIAWEIIDTFTRPDVLAKARAEVAKVMDRNTEYPMGLDATKLFSLPLLQSIYSEELRIRNGVMIQRVPLIDNFSMNGFRFPKDQMIVASSWHEQRDRNVWNEGPINGEFHSVEDFWAERFLVYPNDPLSGPRKPGTSAKSKPVTIARDAESNEPRYTTDPVAGSYIPYGGGAKVCPGRFLAKQEALLSLAMFIMKFDMEFLGDEKFVANTDYFPFGVVPPLGDFRVRMRKRKL